MYNVKGEKSNIGIEEAMNKPILRETIQLEEVIYIDEDYEDIKN